MNADQIRAAFIKRQLAGALVACDRTKMMWTAGEFRKYLQWWADSLSRRERKSVARLLSRLERLATAESSMRAVPTVPRRVIFPEP